MKLRRILTSFALALALASPAAAQWRITDGPLWTHYFGLATASGNDGTLVSNTTQNEQGENEYQSTGASGVTPGVSVNLQSSSVTTITSINTGNKPAGSWIIFASGSCTFAGTINGGASAVGTNAATSAGGGSGAGGGGATGGAGSNGNSVVLLGGGPAAQQAMATGGAGGLTTPTVGSGGSTPATNTFRNWLNNSYVPGYSALGGAAGGAGGLSGGAGGLGGGAFIAVCLGGITCTGTIDMNGGNGTNGNGTSTGGGGGGGGGLILLIAPSITDSCTKTVSGGSGGTGGGTASAGGTGGTGETKDIVLAQ